MIPKGNANSNFKVFMKNQEGSYIEVGIVNNLEIEKIDCNKKVNTYHKIPKEVSLTLTNCRINRDYFYN